MMEKGSFVPVEDFCRKRLIRWEKTIDTDFLKLSLKFWSKVDLLLYVRNDFFMTSDLLSDLISVWLPKHWLPFPRA
jgi:hypothetical protein